MRTGILSRSRPRQDERGEVPSWLILAAGLALAATLAAPAMHNIVAGLVERLGDSAGVEVTIDRLEPGATGDGSDTTGGSDNGSGGTDAPDATGGPGGANNSGGPGGHGDPAGTGGTSGDGSDGSGGSGAGDGSDGSGGSGAGDGSDGSDGSTTGDGSDGSTSGDGSSGAGGTGGDSGVTNDPNEEPADQDAPPPDDPELTPWLIEALNQAGIDWSEWDPAGGVDGNRDIIEDVYTYYGELFLDDPNMQWAGMANMIGPSFAAGFFDLDMFKDLAEATATAFAWNPDLAAQFTALASDLTAEELEWYETQFLDMQRQIFVDQAPAHEAYRQEGIAAIDAMLETGEIDRGMHEAWTLIDQGIQSGDQTLIEAGNLLLLQREQFEIIDDDYTLMKDRPGGELMTYLMTLIGQPSIPGAQSFGDVFPIVIDQEVGVGGEQICVVGLCTDNPLQGSVEIVTPLPNGNIANLDDRWELILQDTLPAFQDVLADPELAIEIISTPIPDRIDDNRLDLQTIIDILTDFQVDFDQ